MAIDDYVYMVHSSDTGLTKIGKSINPYQRIKELNRTREGKTELHIVGIVRIENAYRAEQALHQLFHKYKVKGEWFNIKPSDLDGILNKEKLSQIVDNFNKPTKQEIDAINSPLPNTTSIDSMLSEDDVRERIRKFIEDYPSQSAAARALGISQPYLFEIMKGTRKISENVALKLGIRKEFLLVKTQN